MSPHIRGPHVERTKHTVVQPSLICNILGKVVEIILGEYPNM